MLQPIVSQLSSKRIILASGSPRRKEILSNIGLNFEVFPSKFEETLDKSTFATPQDYVLETARQKTLEVKERIDILQPDLIIGADTVVALDGKILEKPRDADHAFEMLSSLSGRTHSVHTGVVMLAAHTKRSRQDIVLTQWKLTRGQDGEPESLLRTFTEDTDVTFGTLSAEVIKGYIKTGEPLDKAGGYGIQALGGTLVESIRGDYFNVVGFPLHHFCKELLSIHQECWS